jgi:putative glutamine amidotransferase
MTPRVGVTRWEDIPGETIERYWTRIRDAGLDYADLHERDSRMDGLDALVLTGGVDVEPARYGAERHEKVRRIDSDRDEFELGLLSQALARDIPVLAICRGHQLLNVCFGGSLLQHIETGEHTADYRTEGYPSRSHDVEVVPGTRLREWLDAERVLVNSRHHQAVTPEQLAPNLRATALTEDGLVEAVESTAHTWVIGVQWHPERDEPHLESFAARGRRLFAELARACASRRL